MTTNHWKILGYISIIMAWLSIVFPILTIEQCAQMKETETSSVGQLGIFQQIMDMQEELQTGLQLDPELQEMMGDLGYMGGDIDLGGIFQQLEPLLNTTKPMEKKIERRKIRGLDILSVNIHLEDMYNIDNIIENPILEVYFPSYKQDIHLLLEQVSTVLYRIYLWSLLCLTLFAIPIPKLLSLFKNISSQNIMLSDKLQHAFAGLFATFGILFFMSLLICIDVFWDIDGIFGGLYVFVIGSSLLVLATLQITVAQDKITAQTIDDPKNPTQKNDVTETNTDTPNTYILRIAKGLTWSAVVSQILVYIGFGFSLLFIEMPIYTKAVLIALFFLYSYATYIYNNAIQSTITNAPRATQYVVSFLWIGIYLVPNIILPTLLFI